MTHFLPVYTRTRWKYKGKDGGRSSLFLGSFSSIPSCGVLRKRGKPSLHVCVFDDSLEQVETRESPLTCPKSIYIYTPPPLYLSHLYSSWSTKEITFFSFRFETGQPPKTPSTLLCRPPALYFQRYKVMGRIYSTPNSK